MKYFLQLFSLNNMIILLMTDDRGTVSGYDCEQVV